MPRGLTTGCNKSAPPRHPKLKALKKGAEKALASEKIAVTFQQCGSQRTHLPQICIKRRSLRRIMLTWQPAHSAGTTRFARYCLGDRNARTATQHRVGVLGPVILGWQPTRRRHAISGLVRHAS